MKNKQWQVKGEDTPSLGEKKPRSPVRSNLLRVYVTPLAVCLSAVIASTAVYTTLCDTIPYRLT